MCRASLYTPRQNTKNPSIMKPVNLPPIPGHLYKGNPWAVVKKTLNLYWLKCDFLMKLACVLSSTDESSAQAPNHSQGPPVLHGADKRDSEISSAVQVSAQMMMPRHTNIPLPPVSRKKLSFLLVFVHSLQSVPTNTCTDKSLPL